MQQRLFRCIVLAGFLTLSLGLGGFTLWFWHMQQSGTGGEAMLEGLGDFGIVPDFTLIERSEHQVSLHDFQGMVTDDGREGRPDADDGAHRAPVTSLTILIQGCSTLSHWRRHYVAQR